MKRTNKFLHAPWSRLFLVVPLVAAIVSSQAAQKVQKQTQSAERAESKAVERAKYQINLKLDFDLRSYAGSEEVRWINRGDRPTAALYFHLYSNVRVGQPPPAPGSNSAALVVSEADEPRIEVTEVRSAADNEQLTFVVDEQGTTLRVNLREAVAPGGSAKVLINFKGSVPEIDAEETSITTHVIKQV
ncbi:MAG: hypothetical protein H0V18_14070, partial [Pyrinomonadaceae bacterium]|nr:hypothetical protein [Pyrinomonadaceae bacterium]